VAGEPSFFEIGVADTEPAKAFYGELFGWTFDPGPAGGGAVISTPGLPGGMHGGDEGATPYLFFKVDDFDAALAKIRELGGEVDVLPGSDDSEAETITRFGRFALCKDDQGSTFGIHEPSPTG